MNEKPTKVETDVRLRALRRTELLDSAPDLGFDRLTRLAAKMLDAPVALVSLVDADRQFFKSAVGLPEPWASLRETPLSHSFCKHVIASNEPLVIPDARNHPLVRDNGAVTELGVIAYLGIPIRTPDDQVIGSFCVIDTKPREWGPSDVDALRDLAAFVMTEIAARWHLGELKETQQRFRAKLLEHARAEDLLRERERLAQQLTAICPAIFYVYDIEENRTEYFSQEGELVLGYSLGTLREMGGDVASLLLHPDDLYGFRRYLERVTHLADGEAASFEYRMRTFDRSWRWFLSHDTVFRRNPNGSAKQITGVALDITERKRIERDREAAFQQLRDEERLRELLIGMISHDLRTPLASIALGSGLLLTEDGLNEDARELVRRMRSSANRMTDMIHHLLDFAQSRQGGGIAILPADTNAHDVVREVVGELLTAHSRAEVRLECTGNAAGVWDAGRLAQLCSNLVGNAIQHGGGDSIHVCSHAESDRWILEVHNEGEPIARELLPMIFDPFRRARTGSDAASRSVGLGLYISRQIVLAHRGDLEVLSPDPVRGGTTFIVCLPRAPMASMAARATAL